MNEMSELIDMPFAEFEVDPAYLEWQAKLAAHQNCTYTNCLKNSGQDCPEYQEMECYDCSDCHEPYLKRQVIRLGPVVNRADPTQSYVLSCGHYVI
jgi:hypothetical protein